jgi:hypothetical protein
MNWANFYLEGGWGMYPTTLFGFLLVASGVLLLLRPERRFVPLVLSLGLLTLTSGMLGTAMGLINTFHHVQRLKVDHVKLAMLGCAESLNNLVLALLIMGLTMLLTSIAALRLMRNGQTTSG